MVNYNKRNTSDYGAFDVNFNSSYLRINDIVFEVPPQQISIQKQNYLEDTALIRRANKVRSRSTHRTIGITIEMIFSSGDNLKFNKQTTLREWVNAQLAPFLIQVRKCPFVSIENEKIRKEIAGEVILAAASSASNISATFKYANITTIAQSADMINVTLYFEVFNHLPFSQGFFYKIIDKLGRAAKSIVPGPLFKEFYQNERVIDGQFVNEIKITDSNKLEIIYPEYKWIASNELEHKPKINAHIGSFGAAFGLGATGIGANGVQATDDDEVLNSKIKDRDPTNTRGEIIAEIPEEPEHQTTGSPTVRAVTEKDKRMQGVNEKTKAMDALGWQPVKSTTPTKTKDKLHFRYRKFTINSGPQMQPGDLIVEAANAYFESITPVIPLIGHAIPTSQFLGAGDCKIIFTIFAAAEEMTTSGVRNQPGGTSIPVGTSTKLSRLNMILDSIISNGLLFRKYGKNNPIYVRHMIPRLLKRQVYSEDADGVSKYWDEDSRSVKSFDFNDYLACVPDNTVSETVEGMPFCSRFTITLFENFTSRKADEYYAPISNMKDAYNSKAAILKKMVKRLNLKDPNSKLAQGEIDKYYVDPIRVHEKRAGMNDLTDTEINLGQWLVEMLNDAQVLSEPGEKIYSPDEIIDNTAPENKFNQTQSAARAKANHNIKEYYRSLNPEKKVYFAHKVEKPQMDIPYVGPGAELAQAALEYKTTGKVNITLDRRIIPYNVDESDRLFSNLLREIFTGDDADKLQAIYANELSGIVGLNTLPLDSTYPDINVGVSNQVRYQLGYAEKEPINPDFYFYNISSDIIDRGKEIAKDKSFKRKEAVLAQMLTGPASGKATIGDTKFNQGRVDPKFKTGNPPIPATNVYAINKKKPQKSASSAKDQQGQVLNLDAGSDFTQNPTSEVQRKIVIDKAVNFFDDYTYNMRRAMPTFKLLIYDEQERYSFSDTSKKIVRGTTPWKNFFDFYDGNALVDIRLIKDQDSPVDILVIQLMNNKRDLVNRSNEKNILSKWRGAVLYEELLDAKSPEEREKAKSKAFKDGVQQNVIVGEGKRIQLRLGYEADANKLAVQFNGRISSVTGTHILEIVCQGDGVELVQELKAQKPNDNVYTWNSNTPNMISHLFATSKEVKSFGVTGTMNVFGTWSKTIKGSIGGSSAMDNVFAPDLFSFGSNFFENIFGLYAEGRTLGDFLTNGLIITGVGLLASAVVAVIGAVAFLPVLVITALVFAAVGAIYAAFKEIMIFFKGSPFDVYQMTIWDILQELTFRHPGIICAVVPYDLRSTVFFGFPDELYFWRGPNYQEALGMKSKGFFSETTQGDYIREFKRENIKPGGADLLNGNYTKKIQDEYIRDTKTPSPYVPQFNGENKPEVIESYVNDPVKRKAVLSQSDILWPTLKIFRDYHCVTSEHDIIKNGIRVSDDDVYNQVVVMFPNSAEAKKKTGAEAEAEYEPCWTITADDDLNEAYIKTKHLYFKNAVTDACKDLPERYAIANLCESLGNVYKGKLIVLGRPMKPRDIVYVMDNVNQIYGPIEVRRVAQVFSYATGWVTEVAPKMVVLPTDSPGIAQIQAIKEVAYSYGMRNYKIYLNEFLSLPTDDPYKQFDDSKEWGRLQPGSITESLLRAGSNVGHMGWAISFLGTHGVEVVSKAKSVATLAREELVIIGIGEFLTKSFGAVKFIGSAVAKTASIIGIGFLIDWGISYFTNWQKYRQPIVVLPLTRNEKPWYTALHGMKNNHWFTSLADSVTGGIADMAGEGRYLLAMAGDSFDTFVRSWGH